jgi:acetyl esterase/lipase
MTRSLLPFGALLAACCLAPAVAAAQEKKLPALPPPDVKDAKYGAHERNVLDLWKAKSDKPTPVVVYIHGGGFRAGDKSSLSPALLARCRDAGISVAAINYRLSQHAPFPAPMLDGARAVQLLRSKAKDWNLDPARVAATGGSAGAGISLWLAFHDDLADPKSDDPVARQSTRLSCAAVLGAQTSYDPRWIKEKIGGRAHEHPALMPFYGLKADELDSPRAHKLYEEASAINYLTKDDPPVFLFYNEPKGPLPGDAQPGQGIHHPNFGVALKEKMEPLGIECVLRHQDDYRGKKNTLPEEMTDFFVKHFARAAPAGGGEKPRRPARRKGGRPGEVITPAAKGERIADTLKAGEMAPDFTLPLVTGRGHVTLSDFRGKTPVVLVFASYT